MTKRPAWTIENGDPYTDLLTVTPKEAKQDERLRNSDDLRSFCLDSEEWSLIPKTLFYDYIYVKALFQSYGDKLDLSEYDWFTDMEFNPNKSINCQARSVVVYKLIQLKNMFDVLNSKEEWKKFHEEYVRG